LVGRADLVGAEAVCAAVGFLRRRTPIRPVVVLSATTPTSRRHRHAAHTLVATTGVAHIVHLPHDPRLAAGPPLRLHQVRAATARACLQVLTAIRTTQEVLGYVG
ncbi:hypothetical protein, partial [Solihabitans fulvus]|uniref:hypothetical protein n=1 Tax=Solihabitans fulvus TaxID=1892852 RepID=UPI001CB75E1E